MANQFFFIFLTTILVTRLLVYLFPIPAPTIRNFRIHHYMYGVVILILGLTLDSILVFAVGLGLFTDELTYLLIGGKTHKDNYSKISLLGTAGFIAVIFLLRNYLVSFV